MNTAMHAVQCLLWSADCYAAHPSDDLIEEITKQWEDFQERAEALGFNPEDQLARVLNADCDGDYWAAVAHDFIMTRNGHGTGFWDPGRWHEPWGQKLTDLAKEYHAVDVWIDEDNEAHLEL